MTKLFFTMTLSMLMFTASTMAQETNADVSTSTNVSTAETTETVKSDKCITVNEAGENVVIDCKDLYDGQVEDPEEGAAE